VARLSREGSGGQEWRRNRIWKVTTCLPEHASLHRNAITSDAVTRFWRRLSEAAVARRPKRIGNEGRCRSSNGSIPLTTETEARPSWRRTPPAREWPSVAVRPAVQCWRICRFPGQSQHGGVPTSARQAAGVIPARRRAHHPPTRWASLRDFRLLLPEKRARRRAAAAVLGRACRAGAEARPAGNDQGLLAMGKMSPLSTDEC
jgi:hypothetical protein